MPSNIDNRIVNMQFNNKQFESGVSQTMSTLDKFKEKLNLSKSANAFNDLEKAANKVSFSGLQGSFTQIGVAVENVQSKFSAWEVAAKRVIENVVDNAYEGAKRFAKSLSIDQITAGWEKYGDVASSVATIMSATGLSVEDVTAQLERLNWYTDETSYSYQDMASNIGKFTSQKIPLEQATEQMMGIANWAALAGQGAVEASRAMYNIAQSMGQGYMSLMDWRSIENANMGTAQFKEMVLDLAASMGYLKEETGEAGEIIYKTFNDTIVNAGTFSQTLSEKWFTKDVMQEAFSQYGKFAVKLNEVIENLNESDALLNINATDLIGILNDYADDRSLDELNQRLRGTSTSAEEVIGYLDVLTSKEYELSRKAFSAAQEYRTFNDAIEATKDAVSTQWMNTFTAIFGNYEEAKELWTSMGDTLYEIFATAGDERNAVLREWKILGSGGRDDLVEAITESLDSIVEIVATVKDGLHRVFPEMTAENIANIVKSFKSFADTISEFTSSESNMAKMSISVGNMVRGFKNIVDLIGGIFGSIKDAVVEVFASNITIDRVESLTQAFRDFTAKLVPSEDGLNTFKDTLVTVFKFVKPIISTIGTLAKTAFSGVIKIGGWALSIIKGIAKFFNGTIKGVADWFKALGENTKFGDSIKRLKDAFKKLFSVLNGNISKGFDAVGNFFAKLGESERITNALSKFTDILTTVVSAVADFISIGIEKVAEFFQSHNLVEDATKIWNDFSDSVTNTYKAVKDFFAPATEWISEKAETVYSSVSKYFEPARQKIKDFFDEFKGKDAAGVFSTIGDKFGEFGKTIWDWATRLWESLTTEWIPSIVEWTRDKFPALFEWFEKIRDWFSEFAKSEDKFGFLTDSIKNFADAIGDFAGKAWKTLKDVWAWLKEEFNNIGPAGIVLAAFAGALIALLIHLMDALEGFVSPITSVLGAFKNFARSGSNFFEMLRKTTKLNQTANAINTIANAIKTLATALAILTISITIISKVEKPGKALGVLGALTVGLIALMLAARWLGTYKDQEGNLKALSSFADMAKMLLAIALGLFAFVTVIRNAGDLDKEQFWNGLLRAILSLSVIIVALKSLTKGHDETVAVKGAFAILAIVLSLDFLMKSIAKIKTQGMDDAISKILLIGAVAMALGTLGQTFKKTKTKTDNSMTKSTISLLGVAAVMLAFVHVLKQLSSIDLSEVDALPIIAAITLGIVAIFGLSKATKEAGSNVLKVGLGLLTLAKAIEIMIHVMSNMSDIQTKNLVVVGAVFALVIGAISLLLGIAKLKDGQASGAKGAALEIVALAGALTLMAISMGLLALIPWKKLIAPAVAMTAFLLGMTAVVAAASKAGESDNGFKTVIAAGILIAIVGAVIGVLAALNIERVTTAAKIVGAVIALTTILLFAIGYFNKGSTSQSTSVNDSRKRISELLIGVAIVAGLAFLLVKVAKQLESTDTGKLPKFATSLIVLTAGVALIAGAIIMLSKNLPSDFKEAAKAVGEGALALVAGIAGLVMVAGGLWVASKILGNVRINTSFVKTLAAATGFAIIISEALVIFAKQLNKANVSKEAVGNSIKIFVASLGMLVGAALAMYAVAALIDDQDISLSLVGKLAAVAAVAAGVSEVIVLLAAQISKNNVNAEQLKTAMTAFLIGIGMFAAAGLVLAGLGALFSTISFGDDLMVKIGAIGAALGVMSVATELLILFAKEMGAFGLDAKTLLPALEAFGFGMVVAVAAGLFVWGVQSVFAEHPIDIGSISADMLAITEAIGVISLATAAIVGIGKFAGGYTAAWEGMKAVAIMILGFSIIAALFAGLNKIPGFKDFLIDGFEVLGIIVEKLAEIVGRAISKFVDAAFFQMLPDFGAALSDFWTNSEPFFDGLRDAGPEVLDLMGNFAKAMLLLVGAEFVSGIANLLTLGGGAASLRTTLADFGDGISLFNKNAGTDVDPKRLISLSEALGIFIGMMADVPVDGGLVGLIVGKRDFGKFSTGMSELGSALNAFYTAGLGVVPSRAMDLADVLGKLVTSLSSIPTDGGLVGLIVGKRSQALEGFSGAIGNLGEGLSSFADLTGDVDKEKIENAVGALDLLVKLNNSLPKTGGAVQYIIGWTDMNKFGTGLGFLGEGLANFVTTTKELDTSGVESATNALELLSAFEAKLPRSGGALQYIIGHSDEAMQQFSTNLPALGHGISTFAQNIRYMFNICGDDIVDRVRDTGTMLEVIGSFQSSLSKEGGIWQAIAGTQGASLESFATTIGTFGKGLKDFSDNMKGVTEEDYNLALDVASRFVTIISRAGVYDINSELDGLITNIVAFGDGLKYFADKVNKVSVDSLNAGLEFARNFADLAQGTNWETALGFCNAFKELANISIDQFIDKFTEREMDGTTTGITFISKVLFGMQYAKDSSETGVVVKAKELIQDFLDTFSTWDTVAAAIAAGTDLVNKLMDGLSNVYDRAVSIGESIGQGLIDGMKKKRVQVLDNADQLGHGIVLNLETSTETHSPSRAGERIGRFIDLGLINGMNQYSDCVAMAAAGVGDASVEGMAMAIARIKEALTGELDSDLTIRPVLDLSDVSAGSGLMSRMLNAPILAIGGIGPVMSGGYSAELAATLAGQNGIGNSGLISSVLDHIDMLSSDIRDMQLVMDSGAVVGAIASPMDNALGRMAVYKGRGN